MAPILKEFPSLRIEKVGNGPAMATATSTAFDDLPQGEVVIEVAYSSLNYKDALACTGHPGVVRAFPHLPGIDAAGQVVWSASEEFCEGQSVLVTGCGLGSEVWGGFSRYVRLPSEWVVPMPDGLDARRAMAIGTAGFTAAQAVSAIIQSGISPDRGEVVVTGATGGVGLWSVAILAKLGYQVTAVTGKPKQAELLRAVGARQVAGRDIVNDDSARPLLSGQWAAAVDTLGGAPLATILRQTQHRGCVAACGMAAGVDLLLTVHPFILRGVTLAGIDSAKCPRESRLEIWRKLANEWRVELPESCIAEISLGEVPQRATEMLAGETVGRALVVPEV